MLENFLNEKEKKLNLNCSVACLMRDTENFFEKYDSIIVNCGAYIASHEVNAALLAKGATINTGNTIVTDFQGDFVQVSGGVIDRSDGFEGQFVLVSEDVILSGEGIHAFEKANNVIATATVFYPDCCDPALLIKIQGEKYPYPTGSYPLLGDRKLDALLEKVPEKVTEVWLSGELSALNESPVLKAKTRNLHIISDSLFTTEGIYQKYKDVFKTAHPVIVPDGFTVTGPLVLNSTTSVLYGKKLYIRGSFTMQEKDADYLKDFESILVKGCAVLPISCVQAFKAVGTADNYQVFEGYLYTANGIQTFSHDQLYTMVERGEKMTLQINGVALFAEDVTADDIDAIARVDCNGILLVPGAAQSALSQRIGSINGVTLNLEMVKMMSGLSIAEIVAKFSDMNFNGSNINTDVFILK